MFSLEYSGCQKGKEQATCQPELKDSNGSMIAELSSIRQVCVDKGDQTKDPYFCDRFFENFSYLKL